MNKHEAAEFLGVSVRALERYVQQGRIGGHYSKGKTRSTLVFDRVELEAFKAELEQKIYKPAVTSPNPDTALARFDEKSESVDFDILQALLEYQSQRVQTPAHHKLLLTLTEAMALTGLSRVILREAITQGKLKAQIIGKSWRIKRTDLEQYVEKLF